MPTLAAISILHTQGACRTGQPVILTTQILIQWKSKDHSWELFTTKHLNMACFLPNSNSNAYAAVLQCVWEISMGCRCHSYSLNGQHCASLILTAASVIITLLIRELLLGLGSFYTTGVYSILTIKATISQPTNTCKN